MWYNQFEEYRHKQKEEFLSRDNNLLFSRLTSYWYFPESNNLPPCFMWSAKKNDWWCFYELKDKKLKGLSNNEVSELESITIPKWEYHERTFSIMNPKMYNDLSYYLINEKKTISTILFSNESYIYSYSIPFPSIEKRKYPKLTTSHRSRVIYSWIRMWINNLFIRLFSIKEKKDSLLQNKELIFRNKSWQSINSYVDWENHLLKESYKYSYFLQTDVKNFYPSLYTHSIPRIIHSKKETRNDPHDMTKLWNRIDILLQKSHDNCTNWICIGPSISDIIWEIVLCKIDAEVTKKLKNDKIHFVGMRYKDDYRILTESEESAKKILKILRDELFKVKLFLHEWKTIISHELPWSIFRKWIIDTDHILNSYFEATSEDKSNQKLKKISFKKFKLLYAKILEVYNRYPNHAIFEKMLSRVVDDKDNSHLICNVTLENKQEVNLFISLLVQIKNRRLQALPLILWICEILRENITIDGVNIDGIIHTITLELFNHKNASEYELLWIGYFLKKQWWGYSKISNRLKKHPNKLLQSVWKDKQQFFDFLILFDANYKDQGILRNHVKTFGYDLV